MCGKLFWYMKRNKAVNFIHFHIEMQRKNCEKKTVHHLKKEKRVGENQEDDKGVNNDSLSRQGLLRYRQHVAQVTLLCLFQTDRC